MNRTPTRNRNNRNNYPNLPPLLRRRRINSNANVNLPVAQMSFMERMQQEMRQANRPRRESWQNSSNNNANMPNMPSMRERTKIALFEKSPIIEKEYINISVNNPIDVYDYEEGDTVLINPFNLDKKKNIVVFKATNSYFQYPKSQFESDLNNV